TGNLGRPHWPDSVPLPSPRTTVPFRCLRSQRPIFEVDPVRHDPGNAEAYRTLNVAGVLAAPITLQDVRYGVLSILTDRPPLFAEDDLRFLQVLADQVAVILRDRALLRAAAEIEARAEALRLKDDFL